MVEPIRIEEAMEQIDYLLQAGEFDQAAEYLSALHPADSAQILVALEPDAQAALVARLELGILADLFDQMDEEDAVEVATNLDLESFADVLDEMEPDMAADLLGEFEPAEASQVLEQMEEGEAIAPLLAFPVDSAGGIMISPPSLRRFMTVAEAFSFIREHFHDASRSSISTFSTATDD